MYARGALFIYLLFIDSFHLKLAIQMQVACEAVSSRTSDRRVGVVVEHKNEEKKQTNVNKLVRTASLVVNEKLFNLVRHICFGLRQNASPFKY